MVARLFQALWHRPCELPHPGAHAQGQRQVLCQGDRRQRRQPGGGLGLDATRARTCGRWMAAALTAAVWTSAADAAPAEPTAPVALSNAGVEAMAARAPRGAFPRAFSGEQSY